MKFFIADTHFNHDNILRLSNRPFSSIQEHNEALVKNWNSAVRPTDEVYILGDFLESKAGKGGKEANSILSRLHGRKYLIEGNHDGYLKDPDFDLSQFEWVKDYHEFSYNKIKFVLFHYPILEWNGYYKKSIHLYGHVHNNHTEYFNRTLDNRAINVGVDIFPYSPVSIEKIIELTNGGIHEES